MQLVLLLLIATPSTYSFIGFDCGGRHLNITTVSLLDVGECNLSVKKPNNSTVSIQLLQLSDYNHAEVFQCKVEISRTIYHCGMHSHISAVHNGQANYVHETGYTSCMRMFQDGTLSLGPENLLTTLKANSTSYRSITLAGRTSNDGACKGTQYSDPYGTWDDVIVQASVKITLKSSFVPVQLNPGKIRLQSGLTCPLSDSFCLDPDDGYSYWKPMPTSSCRFNQYDVLYEGPATKLETNGESTPPIYSLVTDDITFALTSTKKHPLCGYTLLRTEHPKLFILEIQQGDTFASKSNVPIHNLDIFTYMNSKFVYVEKHIRNQMNSLYQNVIKQKCELERQVINNALSFAILQPDEFAYKLMKGPGYMAVTAGEAVHIVKCIPVEVVLRKIGKCYSELPVTVRNASLYLTPKSRILTKFGNERECSNELPTLYRIEDTWIQFTPKPQVIQIPPQQLQPMVKLSWNYTTPGPLAISGIYSEGDIEKLRNHIMFPAERPALLNEVARRITGYPINPNDISVYNLIDEASLNKIVDSATSRIWKGFISFGSATAGVIGVFMIIKMIKIIIDTTIHGYALHTVYGCSLHLLGAVWSSLTHLLLHLANGPPKKKGQSDDPILPTPHPAITTSLNSIYPAIPTPAYPTAPITTYPSIPSQDIMTPRITTYPTAIPRNITQSTATQEKYNPAATSQITPHLAVTRHSTAAFQTSPHFAAASQANLQVDATSGATINSTAAIRDNTHQTTAAYQNDNPTDGTQTMVGSRNTRDSTTRRIVNPRVSRRRRNRNQLRIRTPQRINQLVESILNTTNPVTFYTPPITFSSTTPPPLLSPRSFHGNGSPTADVIEFPLNLTTNEGGPEDFRFIEDIATPIRIPFTFSSTTPPPLVPLDSPLHPFCASSNVGSLLELETEEPSYSPIIPAENPPSYSPISSPEPSTSFIREDVQLQNPTSIPEEDEDTIPYLDEDLFSNLPDTEPTLPDEISAIIESLFETYGREYQSAPFNNRYSTEIIEPTLSDTLDDDGDDSDN